MINKIREYYKTCSLWIPEYLRFRQIKFRLPNGKLIKIRDTIKSKKQFRKLLIEKTPIDVYYSSGCFLKPSEVRGNLTKNIRLFRDIPFDLDADKPYGKEQLDVVRLSTIKLIENIFYKLGLTPKYILFTGNKGFQVVYEFFNFNKEEQHLLRFAGIDTQVTLDKYRVIRMPKTINKSGRVAVFLTENELLKGMDYILKKSIQIYNPQDCGDRAGRRLSRKTCKSMTIPSSTKVNGRVSGTAPTELSRAIYITNEVKGTKRFIPILIYNWKYTKINPKDDLKLLSEKYELNEWFLIKTSEELFCISLVTFDKRRLQKVLNSTNSEISKSQFKKYNKIYMRTSSINGTDKPIPIGTVSLKNEIPKKFLYSRPHLDLIINYFNFVVNPFIKNYIGYNKPRTVLTIKK